MTSILPEAELTNAVSRATTAAALRPYAQRCKLCGTENDAAPVAICENCLGPLEPLYPANAAAARSRDDRRAAAVAVALSRVAAVRG